MYYEPNEPFTGGLTEPESGGVGHSNFREREKDLFSSIYSQNFEQNTHMKLSDSEIKERHQN